MDDVGPDGHRGSTIRGEEAKLEVRLIGELQLTDNGRALSLPTSRKTRALFVYLLQQRKPVRRERLCELFFDLPDDPRAALRWSLSKIRRMLRRFADALEADRERVVLRRENIETDAERLERWLAAEELPDDPLPVAEAALEAPLANLDMAGLESWSAWLAAERAGLDRIRCAFLRLAAQHDGITPAHRAMFASEAEAADAAVSDRNAEAVTEPEQSLQPPKQSIHYCIARDGIRIAYACTGEGPPLVKAANWLNHLELDWTGPVWSGLFHRLSAHRKLIRYDERGNGLSEWNIEDLSFEAFVTDLETVANTLRLDRFPLLGISQGCAVSIEYAARHPHRVSHLILLGGYAAGWRHIASSSEASQREAVLTLVEHGWGEDNPAYRQIFSNTFMPSATWEEISWFNDFQRRTASASNAARFLQAFSTIDVRPRLDQIECPCLVLHAREDKRIPLASGIELASSIRGATLVTLDTDSHIPLSREPATALIADCIETFLNEH